MRDLLNWRIPGCSGKTITFEGRRPEFKQHGVGTIPFWQAPSKLGAWHYVCAELRWKMTICDH